MNAANVSVNAGDVVRDERTLAVENASYRVATMLMSFALLVDVMVRSGLRREAPWDLLAIVIGGGLVATLYQGVHRILTPHTARVALIACALAAAVGAAVALVWAW